MVVNCSSLADEVDIVLDGRIWNEGIAVGVAGSAWVFKMKEHKGKGYIRNVCDMFLIL